jgi:hypothetical protein
MELCESICTLHVYVGPNVISLGKVTLKYPSNLIGFVILIGIVYVVIVLIYLLVTLIEEPNVMPPDIGVNESAFVLLSIILVLDPALKV